MNKKIQQLNMVDLDRVIKAGDISRLLMFKTYMEEEKQKLEEFQQKIREEAETIKAQAYSETVSSVLEQNAQLVTNFNHKQDELLHKISHDLFSIIDHILAKIGMDNIDINNVQNLILGELEKIRFANKEILVRANGKAIAQFKHKFADLDYRFVTYLVDEALVDQECIIESSLWTMKLDINYAIAEIRNMLQKITGSFETKT